MATVIQPGETTGKRIKERPRDHIVTKHLDGLACTVEQIPDQLLAVCSGILRRSVLRRPLVRALVGAVRGLHQFSEPIVDSRLHDRERPCTQVFPVHRVHIVLPQMLAIPCIGNGIGIGKGGAGSIDVILRRQCPSCIHMTHVFCKAVPGRSHAGFTINIIKERTVQFREVGRLCRPVIHLHIDIGMDIGVPGRRVAVVPDSLQIGRKRDTTAGADEQVTPITEV